VDDNDPIERLLKLAGSRPRPDAERTAAFKSTLHAEWHRVTAPRLRPRTVAWTGALLAAAAALLVVAWLPFRGVAPQAPAATVLGRIVRAEGVVRSLPTSADPASGRPLAVGDAIRTDTVIETTNGRAAIALGAGISLRVDAGSRIAMVREAVVRLDRGAVYVDSGAEKARAVLIRTLNGDVRDIGTRFEVRTEGASLRVRVREGEVIVDRRGSAISARAGELLRIDQLGGYERSTVPIAGPEWGWTEAIAPPFQLEGSTVQQFLDWVAREQGWRWRFVDADTARRAANIVTHGSIEGYTPEEALAIVLPTCGLSFVRDREDVIVSFQKEPSPSGR
jgi:ferric-dicitrate binding protein FerR (iron transport regulator)